MNFIGRMAYARLRAVRASRDATGPLVRAMMLLLFAEAIDS